MPPKKNVNSKSVEARARKSEAKKAEQAKTAKEKEDSAWVDHGIPAKELNKMERAKEKELKKQQEAEKKAKKKALLEKEEKELQKNSQGKTKVTAVQILSLQEKQQREKEQEELRRKREEARLVSQLKPERNVNQALAEQEAKDRDEFGADNVISASGIDSAIAGMSVSSTADRHPEKRRKAAYLAYEEKMLLQLREEEPTLKLSQMKDIIFKRWRKAQENPEVGSQNEEPED